MSLAPAHFWKRTVHGPITSTWPVTCHQSPPVHQTRSAPTLAPFFLLHHCLAWTCFHISHRALVHDLASNHIAPPPPIGLTSSAALTCTTDASYNDSRPRNSTVHPSGFITLELIAGPPNHHRPPPFLARTLASTPPTS